VTVLMNVLSRNSYTFSICECRRSTLDDVQCILLVRRIHSECPFTSICNRHGHYQCRGNQYSCHLHVLASICWQRLLAVCSLSLLRKSCTVQELPLRYVIYSISARRAAALVRKQCHFSRFENVARYNSN